MLKITTYIIASVLVSVIAHGADVATPLTVSSSTGANDAPGGVNTVRIAGGITTKASYPYANLFGDDVAGLGIGPAGAGPWLSGTSVFGPSGTNKIIIGYLKSGTNQAVVGGHSSALNAWAPLSLNGTELEFRIQETLAAKVQSNYQFLIGNNVNGGLSVTGSGYADGNAQIEIGRTDGVSASSYIDLHAAAGSYTDYESRIIRYAGANGDLKFINKGVGTFNFSSEGASGQTTIAISPPSTSGVEGGELQLLANPGFAPVYIDNHSGNFRVFSSSVWFSANQNAFIVGYDPGGTGRFRVDGGADFKGTVRAKEVIVTLNGWSDHVFAPDYQLSPLAEVAEQIESKRHLPGIPSESEILEKGLSMGEMQRLHMAKIEELTLYAIQADREVSTQRKLLHEIETQQAATEVQNQQLVRENTALAARLERIEKMLAIQAAPSTNRP